MENSGLVSADEWKAILSTAYAELYSCVVESGLRYFETTQTITSDGGSSYPEPSNHFSTVGIDYIDSAGQRWEVCELMAQERNLLSTRGSERAVAYMLVDDQLRLMPTPPAGQIYEWLYVSQPPDLAAMLDPDLIDVVTPDGESFLIWSAAVMALAKEESDTALARAERESARERVYTWAVLRALHSPRRRIVADGGDYGPEPGDWRY